MSAASVDIRHFHFSRRNIRPQSHPTPEHFNGRIRLRMLKDSYALTAAGTFGASAAAIQANSNQLDASLPEIETTVKAIETGR
jgi:hypothetical protein